MTQHLAAAHKALESSKSKEFTAQIAVSEATSELERERAAMRAAADAMQAQLDGVSGELRDARSAKRALALRVVGQLRARGLQSWLDRWRAGVARRRVARRVLGRLVRHSRDVAVGGAFTRWVRAIGAGAVEDLRSSMAAAATKHASSARESSALLDRARSEGASLRASLEESAARLRDAGGVRGGLEGRLSSLESERDDLQSQLDGA